jgi:glycogen operon protein
MNAVLEIEGYRTIAGRSHPLGAIPDESGVNFSLYSKSATGVELLLFENHDDPEPVQTIKLDSAINKTFHFWHVYVQDLNPGTFYAYRIDGPFETKESGNRHNKNKIITDPYARGVSDKLWDRVAACTDEDNISSSLRTAIVDISDYDWEGDKPINRPMCESVIYEMHVSGFTNHASSKTNSTGTFSAVIEKIPYLQDLGVTSIELLPIFQFDGNEVIRKSPMDGSDLKNYWGYSTLAFFSPHNKYCVSPEADSYIREFRDMVKALHKAGIEVILDVVFNHTDEGNHMGPTISFKGIDNATYYYLESNDKQYYSDFTGCGNTFNCNHPVSEKFIVDCLEFWVKDMHVDGFRFDEASILSRGENGAPLTYPPVLWEIELNESLADTKIIAEAWDAAGLYQVGYFPGQRWAEWNGKYRDDVRAFVRGNPGIIGSVAARITGSADLYDKSGKLPANSVNFINAHDGFTLNDLVTYNWKHNEANGEDNRDGQDENLSWNCGVEGPTDDPAIESLRKKQIKNFFAILMLSQGTPMFVAGDEFRKTQNGNNNAYCQDNEISWLDWEFLENNKDMYRFVKKMIAFRQRYVELHRKRFFTGEINERGVPDISWHGTTLNSPGWDDPFARVLSFTLAGLWDEYDFHIILNMYWEPLDFELPVIEGRRWHMVINTDADAPNDIVDEKDAMMVETNAVNVMGRSCMVLISKVA